MDDLQRIQAFRETGDQGHFTALVERHREKVFRLICSILGRGREGASEELTQEVFLKAYTHLHQFRGRSKFSTWIYRIAYNHALSYRKSLRFRGTHVSAEVLETRPGERAEDDPHRRTSEAKRQALVEECLDQLPDAQRTALHLFYWMGFTLPEISKTLATPEGTVKSNLHRARARLHQMLTDQGVCDV